MTIQFSVVIWTIINFALLYLVLNFLLFKPMLKHMDERNAKIEQGRAAVAKRQEEEKALAAGKEAFLAEKGRLLNEKVSTGLDAVKEDCRLQRSHAIEEEKALSERDKEALGAEEAALKETLARALPLMSDKVVQSLLEKGL